MFYSRQIFCFNFGIHISDTETGIMCLWDETVTGQAMKLHRLYLVFLSSIPECLPKSKRLYFEVATALGSIKV